MDSQNDLGIRIGIDIRKNEKKKDINMIVATSTNYGIGYDNKMCWHIPEELKHFKRITTAVEDKKKKNCVIMGKNTWYSLPKRPLIDRINIIISSADYDKISQEVRNDGDNIRVFKNIEDAFKYVEKTENIESAFIIGGAQLYNECLDKYVENIRYMYMTIVYDKKYECNKFVAAEVIFRNFKFEKKDVFNSEQKYITMKGYNKGISYPCDEPPD
jgi:dihydrofolate reductase